jgi:hypothetical protein
MARLNTKRKAKRKRGQACAEIIGAIRISEDTAPPRGVRLKTVSRFTMLFAVICLLAFMAGRPPAVATGSSLIIGRKITAVADAPRDAFYLGGKVSRANALSSDALEMQPYIERPFYIGFRVGGYELGLAKRN